MDKEQQAKVKRVNKLLVKQFGIPKRNGKLPDPVDMLIATILSQNTNDNNSYKAFSNLKERYKNWTELLTEKRSSIEKLIKVAGLGLQKSKAIKEFVTKLYTDKGKLSLDFVSDLSEQNAIEYLTHFNGVGVKTASCVLLFALDRNICPVDTHVHRTVNRIGIVKASAPDKTFFLLNDKFPQGIAHQFHTNLIRLGREICKPTRPNCAICPVLKECNYEDKNFEEAKSYAKRDFMLLDNVG